MRQRMRMHEMTSQISLVGEGRRDRRDPAARSLLGRRGLFLQPVEPAAVALLDRRTLDLLRSGVLTACDEREPGDGAEPQECTPAGRRTRTVRHGATRFCFYNGLNETAARPAIATRRQERSDGGVPRKTRLGTVNQLPGEALCSSPELAHDNFTESGLEDTTGEKNREDRPRSSFPGRKTKGFGGTRDRVECLKHRPGRRFLRFPSDFYPSGRASCRAWSL